MRGRGWLVPGVFAVAALGCGGRVADQESLEAGAGTHPTRPGSGSPDASTSAPSGSGSADASGGPPSGSSHPVVVDAGSGPPPGPDASRPIGVADAATVVTPPAPPPGEAESFLMNPAHTNAVSDALLPPLELAWTTSFQYGPTSYPLISGGFIYLVAGTHPAFELDAAGGHLALVALDVAAGATRWSPIDLGTSSVAGHALDGNRVFVVDGSDPLVRAFDVFTGAVLWTAVPSWSGPVRQPPTAYRGLLYVATDGLVSAFDEATGDLAWSSAFTGVQPGSPAVTDDGVFVSYGCFGTSAFDRTTGKPLWAYPDACPGGGGAQAPAVYGGKVYARDSAGRGPVLDVASGALVVGVTSSSNLAFADGLQIVGSPAGVQAFADGEGQGSPLWTAAGELANLPSPIVDGHVVYAGTGSGALFALDEDGGAVLWREQVDLETPFAPFAAADGVLVVPFGSEVLAYKHVDRPDAGPADRSPDGGCPPAGCLGAPEGVVADAVQAFALDAANVYFTNPIGVFALAKGALQGAERRLDSGPEMVPLGIAVDATRVYWTVPTTPSSGVYAAPLAGGAQTPLATNVGVPRHIVVGGANAYWESRANMLDTVMSAPVGGLDGGAAAVVLAQGQGVTALAVDATRVYWSTDRTYATPLAGGAPTAIAPAAGALASDGTYLYWAENAVIGVASVWRVPLAGGDPALLIDGRLSPIESLAVDEGNVYWLEGGNVGGPGALVAMPKAGGDFVVLDADLASPFEVAVDDTGVYYGTVAGLFVVPKTH